MTNTISMLVFARAADTSWPGWLERIAAAEGHLATELRADPEEAWLVRFLPGSPAAMLAREYFERHFAKEKSDGTAQP